MDLISFPSSGTVDLHIGDCLDILPDLPEQHFHSCITSPPYFGLRDYNAVGQIGREATVASYVATLVKVFGAVRRVLRDDATLWVNMGDCYHRKNLMGVPWRLAFALQDDGWILRSDVIWEKPNAMPVSVRDRPTTSHEYIFLLSKNTSYYYDIDAIREPLKTADDKRNAPDFVPKRQRNVGGRTDGFTRASSPLSWPPGGRNKRTVWSVPAQSSFSGLHVATYPPALIEPCVIASCPPEGAVIDPFAGTGTTGLVAANNGRRATLIELNAVYGTLIRQRLGDYVTLQEQ